MKNLGLCLVLSKSYESLLSFSLIGKLSVTLSTIQKGHTGCSDLQPWAWRKVKTHLRRTKAGTVVSIKAGALGHGSVQEGAGVPTAVGCPWAPEAAYLDRKPRCVSLMNECPNVPGL